VSRATPSSLDSHWPRIRQRVSRVLQDPSTLDWVGWIDEIDITDEHNACESHTPPSSPEDPYSVHLCRSADLVLPDSSFECQFPSSYIGHFLWSRCRGEAGT
jgi:hypothetical protein